MLGQATKTCSNLHSPCGLPTHPKRFGSQPVLVKNLIAWNSSELRCAAVLCHHTYLYIYTYIYLFCIMYIYSYRGYIYIYIYGYIYTYISMNIVSIYYVENSGTKSRRGRQSRKRMRECMYRRFKKTSEWQEQKQLKEAQKGEPAQQQRSAQDSQTTTMIYDCPFATIECTARYGWKWASWRAWQTVHEASQEWCRPCPQCGMEPQSACSEQSACETQTAYRIESEPGKPVRWGACVWNGKKICGATEQPIVLWASAIGKCIYRRLCRTRNIPTQSSRPRCTLVGRAWCRTAAFETDKKSTERPICEPQPQEMKVQRLWQGAREAAKHHLQWPTIVLEQTGQTDLAPNSCFRKRREKRHGRLNWKL